MRQTLRAVGIAWLAFVLSHTGSASAMPISETLRDQLPSSITGCTLPPAASNDDVDRRSIYVAAEDHVRLAVDVFTPAHRDLDKPMPTLFSATRYWRGKRDAPLDEVQRRWIAAGYAVVNADVRGTGASFGQWYIPYSRQESRDLGFLSRWIARQPWSNGSVVMTGNSYPGTTPLMATAYGAPAIKAIAPKFSDFDMYTDLLWPGGVVAEDLIVTWGRLVRALDLNEPEEPSDASSRLMGVRPIDGPDGERLLAKAIAEHRLSDWSFDKAAREITFRDQGSNHLHGLTIDEGNVSKLGARIEATGVPIFGWGSWLDSGIAQGLLNRFMTLRNPQVTIIGPWTHGARENVNVFDPRATLDPPRSVQDQWVYCFLNRAVEMPNDTRLVHRLVYYTMGENRWKSTDVWPLPGTRQRKFYLDSGNKLSDDAPADKALDRYSVDFEATTAPANRWATQAGGPRIDYGDRAAADARLLTYTSSPLTQALEITGQPVVTLNLMSNRTDGNFIVYLEDVSPEGRVTYLTEGELRGVHRKLSTAPAPYRTTYPYRSYLTKDAALLEPGKLAVLVFQLQATSVRLEAGHRLRLALAGADKGTFLPVPADQQNAVLQVSHGGRQPSFIEVPEIPQIQSRE
jgi:putative CocE/NonD family hydrolase